MEFTTEISRAFNLSPFEVLKQDKDYVIMMINFYIEKGNMNNEIEATVATHRHSNKNERIRVNDKTATGGWF